MELIDVLDENGKKTGIVRERSLVHEHGDWHGTVHIWVYRISNGRLEILLQKRSKDKDSFPELYDISSAGHIQAGDSFEESAVREIGEELGIMCREEELRLIGIHKGSSHSFFWGKEFINNEYSKVYVYEFKPTDKLVLQESEIEDSLWIELDECIERVEEESLPNCIFEDELQMLKRVLEA